MRSKKQKFFFLMVCSERWDESGAHIIHPLEISQQLIKQGHDVMLFIPKVKKLVKNIDVPYEMIPAPRIFKGSSFIFFEILLPFYIARYIQKARHTNKKVILYTRHREIGLSSLMIKDIFQIPFINEYNDIVFETISAFSQKKLYSKLASFIKTNPVTKFLITTLEKVIFRSSDAVIAVTPELKKYIIDIAKISDKKVTVVPNGCNIDNFTVLDKYKCRAELNLDPDNVYLGHIGSLNPWQGIDDVLSTMSLLVKENPKTILLIVGEGPYRQNLETKTNELGLNDNVIFTGHIPYEKVNLYIGASDVCMFLKTMTSYGLSSLKLYEYMGAGKPIIGRNIPSLRFIKEHDIGILLPAAAKPEEIRSAIKDFLDRPDLEQLGQRARKLAETVYSWEIAAKTIVEVCEDLD
jgi:glycosyltransferase involved in cell wall biosynthesis